jgi:hypothetical protein
MRRLWLFCITKKTRATPKELSAAATRDTQISVHTLSYINLSVPEIFLVPCYCTIPRFCSFVRCSRPRRAPRASRFQIVQVGHETSVEK